MSGPRARPASAPAADPATVGPLSEPIYRTIRHRIVHGHLRPGQRLDIGALTAELGVSKTPLRQALARLQTDQLVLTVARSGTYVATITPTQISEVLGVRKAVEWFATYEATTRLPDEAIRLLTIEVDAADRAIALGDYEPFYASDMHLHRTIVEYAQNPRLITLRDSIEAYLEWLRIAGATGTHRVLPSAHRHHQLLDAIRRRDPAAAQQIAVTHIDEVHTWILEDLGQPHVPA